MQARAAAAGIVLIVLITAAVAGCGGGQGPGVNQPTAAPSNPGSGQATQGPGASAPGVMPPDPGGGGGDLPTYKAATATAKVTVAGTSFEITGGTCKQDATVYPTFELVAGTLETEQSLDVFVTDMSNPIHDGDYQGGLTLVTVGVDGEIHVVPGKVTLANGQTSGSFSGTAAGNNPVEVSGDFTC